MAFLKKSIKNSTAQATVEYLLLIVVVIALATGIGGPLGIYLKKFSGALLGPQGYYACLTERGLLPGDPQVPSQCSRQAQLAMGALNQIQTGSGFGGGSGGGSVNNGGGNSGNNGGNNGSNNGGNNNGSNSADNKWNNNNDSNDNDSASSSGNEDNSENRFKDSKSSKDKNQNASRHKAGLSGQEGEGSLSVSGGGAFSGDSSNSPSSFLAPNSFSGKGKKKKKKRGRSFSGGRGLGSKEEGGAFNNKRQGYKRLRFRAQTAQGYLGEAYLSEEEAEQDKPVFKEAQISGGSGGSFAGDTKKNPLIPDRKPNQKKDLDTKVKGMNFSAFLKYFVIIALILVVLVVIFSQVMEYQSRE